MIRVLEIRAPAQLCLISPSGYLLPMEAMKGKDPCLASVPPTKPRAPPEKQDQVSGLSHRINKVKNCVRKMYNCKKQHYTVKIAFCYY